MEIMEYQETFGKINFQDGFLESLKGKSIAEQIRCYALTEFLFLTTIPYTALEDLIKQQAFYLNQTHAVYSYWKAIVKDDIVVGFAYPEYGEYGKIIDYIPLLPYRGYVFDTTSDNNGAGYKERDWYEYLICLPENHSFW